MVHFLRQIRCFKMNDKSCFRKKSKNLRDSFDRQELHEKSLKILKILYDTDVYNNAKQIFTYINYSSEAETVPLIRKAISDGKTVAAPIIRKNSRDLIFAKFQSVRDLIPNRLSILEPVPMASNLLNSNKSTLLIVPGLAFNNEGYRLGYGGGFYDKYISENQTLANIGIYYSFQYSENLPIESHDQKLDMIITDGGIIYENIN